MATTTNFGWETPDDTDLVKDGAAAIRTALGGVDTSFVDLKGGTTGQVLSKASNTDLDFTWTADASGIPATIFDAKGDLIAASAADTAARLAVGADYGFLSALATEATGLKWNASGWTSYTPTISAQSGTITTASATGYWIRVGKMCVLWTSWSITTNGTGATSIKLTLPFTAVSGHTASQMGAGREYDVTGKMLQLEIPDGQTYVAYRNYDNTYPGANGYKGAGTICYEVA